MAKIGDRYRCPDVDCGCELEVKRGPTAESEIPEAEQRPSCFCGEEMEPVSRSEAARN